MSSEVSGFDGNYSKQFGSMSGGKRKSKSKKGNGHKMTCACPICKNMMKKGKKGGVLLVGGNKQMTGGAEVSDDVIAGVQTAAVAVKEAADALTTTDAEKGEDEDTDTDAVAAEGEGGGRRRRSSKRSKGKKSKKGSKRNYYGGKKSKKRGKKSRRYYTFGH